MSFYCDGRIGNCNVNYDTIDPLPPTVTFFLKDSPAEVVAAAGVAPKGRTYTTEYYSKRPGAITAEDLVLGTKLACVSITDDKE